MCFERVAYILRISVKSFMSYHELRLGVVSCEMKLGVVSASLDRHTIGSDRTGCIQTRQTLNTPRTEKKEKQSMRYSPHKYHRQGQTQEEANTPKRLKRTSHPEHISAEFCCEFLWGCHLRGGDKRTLKPNVCRVSFPHNAKSE